MNKRKQKDYLEERNETKLNKQEKSCRYETQGGK